MGNPLPTIDRGSLVSCHDAARARTYGKQSNGMSQAGVYGDDAQAATNYALVRIVNLSTGRVFYARTHAHSSMGVATGSPIVARHFDVPAGIDLGASQLEVVTNGIASSPMNVTIN